MDVAFLVGRILLGLFYLYNGYHHLANVESLASYARSKGVPAPKLAIIGTGLLLLAGGLSFVTGLLPLVGVAAVAVFFIGVTPIMHDFWDQEGQSRRTQRTQFLKNMAILGASLALLAIPTPWPLSLGGLL